MTDESASQKTIEVLEKHISELRLADQRYYEERISHLQDNIISNDRRYTEVGVEREKALAIEKNSTSKALDLAREAQNIKDKQTEQLRDETLGKSGIYATNENVNKMFRELEDAIVKGLEPINAFISNQRGAAGAQSAMSNKQIAWVGIVVALVVGVVKYLGV